MSRCALCGDQMARDPGKARSRSREHLIPKSRGGGGMRGNIVGACQICNELKDSMTVAEFLVAIRDRHAAVIFRAIALLRRHDIWHQGAEDAWLRRIEIYLGGASLNKGLGERLAEAIRRQHPEYAMATRARITSGAAP